ncbi:MAG: hypothetical protein DKM50_06445 [Candidatus Margulisiibacteriota bacterium]|nr:MAG: hypothetical protein A2X43_00565 [Candidatus Margulisbacteria bacterium GWD2_39_127]OGI04655.1 MAG: hypothetical protein A2X42_08130 [Candidatus Margulisbacteria bacterium GWF2_38_17]OGI11813.1 MAG: hypothetical protein A2X41_11140 [Candidatus Margulisbacteria bacterium GWE2_39_32]PZM79817.1 MAG: hypothetical protein DKM50_06445 [Candidatus Margulisiibacteriota bacterium]HAR62725.1 hypothetical protein [Candidatus Margulisiibacteriota bacterium]
MIKDILVKRLLLLFPLLLGITLISYFLMVLAPGDPSSMMLDPKIKPADLVRIKENLGLNKPVIVQYFYWLKNVTQGNFGYSYINGRPVFQVIVERLPATLILMSASLFLTLILTVPLGILAAVYNRKHIDNVITIFTFVGMSIPAFWLGLMSILFFSLILGWFPSSGMLDPMRINDSIIDRIKDISLHLILPLLTMTVGNLAGLTKYMKTGMLNVLNQDYILAARSRGFSEFFILWKYAFKNAILPIITILGLSLPNLVGGSFIIEYIFAWPGMGRLGVDSIFMRDFPVIMGIILVSSALIILGNLLADISYYLVDPRISYTKRS